EKTVTIDASEVKYSGSADINNYDVKIPETTTANIKKADMSSDVSVTAKEAKTYRGTAYEIDKLLNISIPEGANIKYGMSETDCANDTLSCTNAGTYTVYYTVSRNNYNAVTGTVDITIAPKTLTEDMIKLDSSENSYVFDGEKITPSVTVSDERDGVNIITSGDYAVSGDTSGLAYGTYILTVTGQNNYKGAANITWNILDRNAPEGVIEIDGNKWRKLLKTITFGLFSKETKTVTITGADGENESGIGGISYCTAEKPLIDVDMTDAEILDVLSRAEWTELALKDG
ncbi:hypothetical protein LI177_14500, partial [bacterium 210820-DFI.6.37]|nr:hypothetical protein [bacterium 210820-DFI.6.37]